MVLKYVCFDGPIRSQHDGDTHWIRATDLPRLYGVKPDECIFVHKGLSTTLQEQIAARQGLIHLYPRSDGNYVVPDANP